MGRVPKEKEGTMRRYILAIEVLMAIIILIMSVALVWRSFSSPYADDKVYAILITLSIVTMVAFSFFGYWKNGKALSEDEFRDDLDDVL